MEKDFKRAPGDMVWIMHDNKAVCAKIISVFFTYGYSYFSTTNPHDYEEYTVTVGEKRVERLQLRDMFSTKEELIASL